MFAAGCAGPADDLDALAASFQDPGNEARPRAYWNWLNGCVTHDGLTRDLEEAKAKGMGGLEMWDTEAMRNPDGFVPAEICAVLRALGDSAVRVVLQDPEAAELREEVEDRITMTTLFGCDQIEESFDQIMEEQVRRQQGLSSG